MRTNLAICWLRCDGVYATVIPNSETLTHLAPSRRYMFAEHAITRVANYDETQADRRSRHAKWCVPCSPRARDQLNVPIGRRSSANAAHLTFTESWQTSARRRKRYQVQLGMQIDWPHSLLPLIRAQCKADEANMEKRCLPTFEMQSNACKNLTDASHLDLLPSNLQPYSRQMARGRGLLPSRCVPHTKA